MRISVVTDAWYPQPNGAVRVMGAMVERLQTLGHEVQVIAPNLFATLPCPTYPDIRLSLFPGRRLSALLDDDLAAAAIRARDIDPALCRNHALGFSWDAVVSEFLDYLAPFGALQEPPAQAAQ